MIYYLEDNRWPWKDLFLCTCKGSRLSKIPVTAHVWICSSSPRDERGRIHSYISHQQLGTEMKPKLAKRKTADQSPKVRQGCLLVASQRPDLHHTAWLAAPCPQEQPLPASSLLFLSSLLLVENIQKSVLKFSATISRERQGAVLHHAECWKYDFSVPRDGSK